MEKIKGIKGQLKIQEMAFVLLALVVLGGIVFVFSIKLQSNNISAGVALINEQRALNLRDKIATLTEIKCAKSSCIDVDKAEMIKNYNLDYLFQGLSGAKIVQIYPTSKEIVLYGTNNLTKPGYSTFVNLCEQKKIGTVFDYDCGLAMLVVSTK